MHIAIQMDAVEGIHPRTDSTLILGAEATRRGYGVFAYEPKTLAWREGRLTARGRSVAFRTDTDEYFTAGEYHVRDLAEMDVVLMRQDPPFDMTYLTATHLLERLPAPVRVLNDPAGVRNAPEKLLPLAFADYLPPTLISADIHEIEAFRREHKDIVLKPLYGFGGHGVFRIREDDDNFHALVETHFTQTKEPLMAQRTLPEVKTSGDRRIILIDGEVEGAFARLPAGDDIRANMRVGGTPVKAELTKRQRALCETLAPELRARGLFLVGLDMIGDFLIEINVTSPTGLAALQHLYGTTPEQTFWDKVERLTSPRASARF